ncbi:MAG TPA: sugar ABC transporter permease [Pyrinomonadaceae bacterium]|nr:sugar ABC transporter permease [Pyrinomonadaceae bacterium]
MSERIVNEPAVDRPPVTADVSPPGLSPEGERQTRIAGLRLQTEQLRAYSMLFALVVIWVFFQWATVDERNPYGLFLGAVNFSKLLQQMAVTGVLAVGMLMVIVAGQIDLSVGSVVGLLGFVSAWTLAGDYGLPASLAAAVLAGILIGSLQGSLVAYANVPAFIVTLGGLLAWRGTVLWLSSGNTIPIQDPNFIAFGRNLLAPQLGMALAALAVAAIAYLGVQRNRARRRHGLPAQSTGVMLARIILPAALIAGFVALMNKQGGVPIPVVVLLAVALMGAFLTQSTTFGRYLYAIGGNPDAARLSGISLRRHILAAFALMGALAGVAAILHTARLQSSSPDAGNLMELDAIAACVIGGTSLMGGRGTVFGAVLGALIMASLDNGMSLLNVQNSTQYIIKGAVLVTAVWFDMLGRRRG